MHKMPQILLFVLVATCVAAAYGAGYITSVEFPKTFGDLSFIDRMAVIKEGFDDYDSEYVDGKCVRGCLYPGITIEEETEYIARRTQMAQAYLNTQNNGNNTSPGAAQPTDTNNDTENNDDNNQRGTDNNNDNNNNTNNDTNNNGNSGHRVPSVSPVDKSILISSDFGPRRSPCNGCSNWHRGLDIAVPMGSNVLAAGDGVVEHVWTGRGITGKAVTIRHTDPHFRTTYIHLSDNSIVKQGDTVRAGQLIAKSGTAGTGPHLHYIVQYTPDGEKFTGATKDGIDPLWTTNYLGTNYKFKSHAAKSCLHKPENFCADQSKNPKPPAKLPGEL